VEGQSEARKRELADVKTEKGEKKIEIINYASYHFIL